jgi:hypothetical protein
MISMSKMKRNTKRARRNVKRNLSHRQIKKKYPNMKELLENSLEGIEQYILMHSADSIHRDGLVQCGREQGLQLVFLEDNADNTVFVHTFPLVTDPRQLERAAYALAGYISDRAAIEGVASKLDPEWFLEQLVRADLPHKARTTMFGVVVAALPGGVVGFVRDEQEPHHGYMNEWLDALHAEMVEHEDSDILLNEADVPKSA